MRRVCLAFVTAASLVLMSSPVGASSFFPNYLTRCDVRPFGSSYTTESHLSSPPVDVHRLLTFGANIHCYFGQLGESIVTTAEARLFRVDLDPIAYSLAGVCNVAMTTVPLADEQFEEEPRLASGANDCTIVGASDGTYAVSAEVAWSNDGETFRSRKWVVFATPNPQSIGSPIGVEGCQVAAYGGLTSTGIDTDPIDAHREISYGGEVICTGSWQATITAELWRKTNDNRDWVLAASCTDLLEAIVAHSLRCTFLSPTGSAWAVKVNVSGDGLQPVDDALVFVAPSLSPVP